MVGYSVHLKNKKIWLEALLKGEFFVTCDEHEHLKKNDKNAFCIDCRQVLCQHCIIKNSHHSHQLIQIRRYVYHNVVRVIDMNKYFDCSRLQDYTLNHAKVIFLNCRTQPQSKPAKSVTPPCCEICYRPLSDSNRYCSIACKIAGTLDGTTEDSPRSLSFGKPGRNWTSSENLELSEDQEEEDGDQNDDDDDGNEYPEDGEIDQNSEILLKPKTSSNKRKGIPRRSPLF